MFKRKFIRHAIYEINWVDTYGYSGWHTEEEIDKKTDNCKNLLVGYFVKETKDYIILVMGREAKNEDFVPYNNPKWIPKGFIKSIKRLK